MIIQDDLKIDSSQTNNLKKIFEQTSDGDLLSVVIQAISTQHKQNEDEISRLVMSWDFQHMDADYTHETIYDMEPINVSGKTRRGPKKPTNGRSHVFVA